MQSPGARFNLHQVSDILRTTDEFSRRKPPYIRLKRKANEEVERASMPTSPTLLRTDELSPEKPFRETGSIYLVENTDRPPCRQSTNAYHLDDFLSPSKRRTIRTVFLRPPTRRHNRSVKHSQNYLSEEVIEDTHRPDSDFQLRNETAVANPGLPDTSKDRAQLYPAPVGISLNKRKGSALVIRPKRIASRISAFYSLASTRNGGHSSSRKEMTAWTTSLEPEFLGLFGAMRKQS